MKKTLATLLLSLLGCLNITMAQNKTVELRIIETSDVHGSFFPYDLTTGAKRESSVAQVYTYVKQLRQQYGDRLLLLDNGDILQGRPLNYFFNFVKTDEPNIAAEVINYMGYDAETIGNHDVETGHAVYDKWISEVKCPMLGANIIDNRTGKPYVKPYTILNRAGVKIAVLGLLTPAIPNWLSEDIWSGMHFDEMVHSARQWMNYIQTHERPDIVIGLFHSGKEGGITTTNYEENASLRVAREVPGFDLIFFGHDHRPYSQTITNQQGRQVVCLDPANNAHYVADATVSVTINDKGTFTKVNGKLKDVSSLLPDQEFCKHFKKQCEEVERFSKKKIGTFKKTISTRDSYFGPSAFNDLILNLELQVTGADIAFNAPLSFDASIEKGPVTVGDMFKLYKYENKLYVMKLTGEEVRKHLEMSYDLWVNTMKSPDDHLLLLNDDTKDDQQKRGFKNLSFNFDSAAGIDYIVDVTKPDGQKVKILRMSNGQPFQEDKWYKVAVNSYRGNGGGELLTQGAGIPHDSLASRVIWRSDKDQRYYLMQEISKQKVLDPEPNNNWKFVPEAWTVPAAKRDYVYLYGEDNKKSNGK